MEAPDNIWLNPVIELPMVVGIILVILMGIASLVRVRWGLLALIASVPLQRFVVIPGILGDRFTPHEVAFLSFTFAALIRGSSKGIKLTPPWTGPIAVPLLSLLSVSVMSLLGNPFLEVGMAEIIIIGYLYMLTHTIFDACSSEENAFFVYRVWYLTAVGFVLLAGYGGVAQLFGIDTFVMLGPRLIATFFNANQAGSFILATSFMFLAWASDPRATRWKRASNVFFLFCALVGAYFTASRATLLGGGGGLLVFLAMRRVRITAIIAIAAALIAGRLALGEFRDSEEKNAEMYSQRYSEGIDPDSQSAQVRLDNWRTGIEAFAQSPVVGIGLGTLWMQTPPTSGESYQVHNTYLSFLGETGILGFIALCGLIGIVVRESILGVRHARGTPYEDPLMALIPALAAMGIFNIFHYGIRARHLWVTMALLFVFRRLATQHVRRNAGAAPPVEMKPRPGPAGIRSPPFRPVPSTFSRTPSR